MSLVWWFILFLICVGLSVGDEYMGEE